MTTTTRTTATIVGLAGAALLLWKVRPLTPSVETSEGFDLSPYGGPVIYPPALRSTAQAIARAEGFYVAGSIPQRAHNPGDLKPVGWSGPTLGNGIAVFADDGAGWDALYKQLYRILIGSSSVYSLDMTLDQMAAKWTGNDHAASWASTVADFLGTDETAPLWVLLA